MKIRSHEELFDRLWAYLVKLIQKEVEKSNESRVASQIKVEPSTVHRWIEGERGERVTFASVVKIIFSLGGTMADIAKELGDEESAILLELMVNEPDLMRAFITVVTSDTPEAEKLKSEIAFLNKSIKPK